MPAMSGKEVEETGCDKTMNDAVEDILKTIEEHELTYKDAEKALHKSIECLRAMFTAMAGKIPVKLDEVRK